MFTYYQEIRSSEHCPYASEIAEFGGIYSERGLPHSQFVSAWLNSAWGDRPVLKYATGRDLARVYQDWGLILQMYEAVKEAVDASKKEDGWATIVKANAGGRNYALYVSKIQLDRAVENLESKIKEKIEVKK